MRTRSSTGDRIAIRDRKPRWHRFAAGAAALALGAVVLAACGSTSGPSGQGKSGQSSTTLKLVTHLGNGTGGELVTQANALAGTLVGPKGTGLTRGITSSSITVGCVTTTAAYTGYQTGIEAEFNAINKKGGIFGRKLTLSQTCKNDNGTAATNTTDNRELVNQTQVFAVLSLTGYELPGSTNFLNSNQVPFEGWGFDPGFCGTRWGFGWNGDLCGNSATLPMEAIAGNLTQAIIQATGLNPKTVRFAVQATASPNGPIGEAQYDAEIEKLGGKVVYSRHNYPTTVAGVDNTPYVQAVLATNPNLIFISTPFTAVGPMSAAFRAAGYTGVIMNYVDYVPGLLTASPQLAAALTGEYINTQVVPAEEGAAYDKAIEADLTAIGKRPFITLGSFIGFAEAEQLADMVKAAGKNLNTKTFTQAVNNPKKSLTTYKTAPSGGPGMITWPAAHYLPADCAAIVRVTHGKFTVAKPFKCYTSFKVTKTG